MKQRARKTMNDCHGIPRKTCHVPPDVMQRIRDSRDAEWRRAFGFHGNKSTYANPETITTHLRAQLLAKLTSLPISLMTADGWRESVRKMIEGLWK